MANEAYEIDGLLITDIISVSALDPTDGSLKFVLEDIKTWTMANTEEKESITGRGGRVLKNIKKNKKAIFTGESAKYSLALIEAQSGGTLDKGTDNMGVKRKIRLGEEITTTVADSAKIKYVAVGTVGNEIPELYIRTQDGLGKKLTQDSAVGVGKFTYDPSTKTITFNTDEVPIGTDLVAYYDRNINMVTVNNPSDMFSKSYPFAIDVLAEGACNKVYFCRINIPKGELDGNFNLTGGDTVGTQSFSIECLTSTGKCPGVYATGNNLWDMVIFGQDAEDAV